MFQLTLMTTKGIFLNVWNVYFPRILKPTINKDHLRLTPMSTEFVAESLWAGVLVIGATSHVRTRISTTSHYTYVQ